MYSSLAPRLGQTTYAASSVGTAELRGGKINWGSLGSSISNAFRTTGRFLGSTASRFAKSQAFQDIKRGINDSGLIRNVAGLAGDTLNSLLDVGRLKLENDLYNLRRKALHSIPADQLAQILQNYQQTHDTVTIPEQQVVVTEPPEQPVAAVQVPALETTNKRPLVEEVVEPAVQIVEEPPELPAKKRLRGVGLEWQQQLRNMLGEGVRYSSTKHCY
ncbi:pVI [Great tit adenovirus 1]|uniref:PVI n=1 Tax=Great tit adenovirus 1 TaxID=676130 RepID=D0QX18_9ADEN|nr:pVI [Great tit adenovirus 1]ACW84429.1 pVI [Great tit adenovirus 1]